MFNLCTYFDHAAIFRDAIIENVNSYLLAKYNAGLSGCMHITWQMALCNGTLHYCTFHQRRQLIICGYKEQRIDLDLFKSFPLLHYGVPYIFVFCISIHTYTVNTQCLCRHPLCCSLFLVLTSSQYIHDEYVQCF